MMSSIHSIFVVLLFAAFAHAQYFPLAMDPYEMAERIQRMANPHPQYANSGSFSSSSSSSSSGGGPVYFGGAGFNPGFGNAPFYPNGPGYEQNFGTYENGGSLGIRFGSVPGGQGVQVSSSSHSNGSPGSSGSFVSSSSSTDGDGKIHYNVQSGRY